PEGSLIVYLGPKELDAVGNLVSPHVRLIGPEFDFKADVVLSLRPSSLSVQAVDVGIETASFRSARATGRFHVGEEESSAPGPIDPVLATFENLILSLEHLNSHGKNLEPGGDRQVDIHGGPVRLSADRTHALKKEPLTVGTDSLLLPLDDTTPITLE